MDGWMDAITETGEVREGGELARAPRANVCVIESIPRCTNALSFALTRTHTHARKALYQCCFSDNSIVISEV